MCICSSLHTRNLPPWINQGKSTGGYHQSRSECSHHSSSCFPLCHFSPVMSLFSSYLASLLALTPRLASLTSFPSFFLPCLGVGGLSLLCSSPGTAAQSNPFNYHSQPALSYHRGCAAPSVFPSWLCREDRHLPKVSWSASPLFLPSSLSLLFHYLFLSSPFFYCWENRQFRISANYIALVVPSSAWKCS